MTDEPRFPRFFRARFECCSGPPLGDGARPVTTRPGPLPRVGFPLEG